MVVVEETTEIGGVQGWICDDGNRRIILKEKGSRGEQESPSYRESHAR